MDLLTAPWIFPWRSPLLPYCSSARKVSAQTSEVSHPEPFTDSPMPPSQLYAMALASNFRFRVPGLPGRTLDRAQFFDLVFCHLLPSFPDLSFNAHFLTTTGLDDCSHVEIQARGSRPQVAALSMPNARLTLPFRLAGVRHTHGRPVRPVRVATRGGDRPEGGPPPGVSAPAPPRDGGHRHGGRPPAARAGAPGISNRPVHTPRRRSAWLLSRYKAWDAAWERV